MSLLIKHSNAFESRALKVTQTGVEFAQTAFLGGKRVFQFNQIEYVLMGADQVLAFQVGQEVFSLQTNPAKEQHTAAIEALLAGVMGSAAK